MTATTKTITIHGLPTKPRGWCAEQGIEHAWAPGSPILTKPPIERRFCINCGLQQHFTPGRWEDSPGQADSSAQGRVVT